MSEKNDDLTEVSELLQRMKYVRDNDKQQFSLGLGVTLYLWGYIIKQIDEKLAS